MLATKTKNKNPHCGSPGLQVVHTDGFPATRGEYRTLTLEIYWPFLRVPLAPCGKAKRMQEDTEPGAHPAGEWARSLWRRRNLLLVVVLAVELLVPVEAGGLQGLFAGGALHALLMPEAVVEP